MKLLADSKPRSLNSSAEAQQVWIHQNIRVAAHTNLQKARLRYFLTGRRDSAGTSCELVVLALMLAFFLCVFSVLTSMHLWRYVCVWTCMHMHECRFVCMHIIHMHARFCVCF